MEYDIWDQHINLEHDCNVALKAGARMASSQMTSWWGRTWSSKMMERVCAVLLRSILPDDGQHQLRDCLLLGQDAEGNHTFSSEPTRTMEGSNRQYWALCIKAPKYHHEPGCKDAKTCLRYGESVTVQVLTIKSAVNEKYNWLESKLGWYLSSGSKSKDHVLHM